MKRLLLAASLLPLAMSQALAGEFSTGPAATAYWQIPLATSQRGAQRPAFGLRFDHEVRDHSNQLVSSFAAPLRPALVDVRFNDRGLRGMYVNGMNLASPTVLRAAEAGDQDTVLWWVVGGTVAAMVGLAIWADDQGGVTTTPTNQDQNQDQDRNQDQNQDQNQGGQGGAGLAFYTSVMGRR